MNESSRPRAFDASFLLVGTQIAASAAIVLHARLSFSHVGGLVIAVAGVLFGVWAIVAIGLRRVSVMPELKPDAKLVISGPYRWVRHPMYTALLLFTGGLAFSPFAVWKCLVWCVLVGVLLAKSRIEERHLHRRFSEYDEYSRRTKRLIPFVL